MPISTQAVIQRFMALVKYGVLLLLMVLGFKFWVANDLCHVDSEDRGMRPAIGNTRTWLTYDHSAWTEADLALSDVGVVYRDGVASPRGYPARVVATSGEWISVDMGHVIRYPGADSTEKKVEEYTGAELKVDGSLVIPRIKIPRGYVLMMPDNRADSMSGSPLLIPVYTVMGKAKM